MSKRLRAPTPQTLECCWWNDDITDTAVRMPQCDVFEINYFCIITISLHIEQSRPA